MRVAVVAEYYPRAADPVLGVWAHRQALAARDAGAEVRVLVLHRPLPPLAAVRAGELRALTAAVRQPRRAQLDGVRVEYVPFLAPPRPWSYGSWGAWAAPSLAVALRRLRTTFAYDLVHAHYAVPAGEAVRRARLGVPYVVSVHGGDVLWAVGQGAGRRAVPAALGGARLVLANSAGIERRCRALGARATRVVHLGTDLPPPSPEPPRHELVSVGHLVERKRHVDVVRALARLGERWPQLRYRVIGDGPERGSLQALAENLGVGDRVLLRGQLPHAQALAEARGAALFVLPSTGEAFGVAYVEAMAAGVPAIGCRGEDGPEEIAGAGAGGLALVPAADVGALAARIDSLLSDEAGRQALGRQARETVAAQFTWERCGARTLEAYSDAAAM